ncbi:MAG: helix-turn-helix domain-containing protein [Bacteroidales bacterium]|nr:helix-turn-helix domain-containing protein [Bacteroidales bacterium]
MSEKKKSATAIAILINVSKSTVSREIKRNLNMYRHYVWIDAQQFSDMRKHIPRRTRARTIVFNTIKQRVRRYSSKPNKISADERRCAKRAPHLCAVKMTE